MKKLLTHFPCLQLIAVVIVWTITGCGGGGSSGGGTSAGAANNPVEVQTVTQDCIESGNEASINAALVQENDEAVLCANSVFDLSSSVEFSADGQSLYTEDKPEGSGRAVLRIVDSGLAVAIQGNGHTDITLSHVEVDGNRPGLGFAKGVGGGLLQMGGTTAGQLIEHVKAYDPRGWSILVINEGDGHVCRNVVAQDNELGPAGFAEYIMADGISLACRDSVVQFNTIIDATDGGIIVFQAPGSLVSNNTIINRERVAFYGISMIDYGPFDGDFVGTQVENNVIDAEGALIRQGIAMGPTVGCFHGTLEEVSRGAVVSNNRLTGSHMGYGFVASGVADWTVTGNVDESTHLPIETMTDCDGTDVTQPAGFQYSQAYSQGEFQDEFEDVVLGWAGGLWKSSYIASESCLLDYVDADEFEQVKNGTAGPIWIAIEELDGGEFVDRCITEYDPPAMPPVPAGSTLGVDYGVLLSPVSCSAGELRLRLESMETTETLDTSDFIFQVNEFEVNCEGLPASLAATDVAECTITDFVAEEWMHAEWYGLPSVWDNDLWFDCPLE